MWRKKLVRLFIYLPPSSLLNLIFLSKKCLKHLLKRRCLKWHPLREIYNIYWRFSYSSNYQFIYLLYTFTRPYSQITIWSTLRSLIGGTAGWLIFWFHFALSHILYTYTQYIYRAIECFCYNWYLIVNRTISTPKSKQCSPNQSTLLSACLSFYQALALVFLLQHQHIQWYL